MGSFASMTPIQLQQMWNADPTSDGLTALATSTGMTEEQIAVAILTLYDGCWVALNPTILVGAIPAGWPYQDYNDNPNT
jgi:hypothetical protein